MKVNRDFSDSVLLQMDFDCVNKNLFLNTDKCCMVNSGKELIAIRS